MNTKDKTSRRSGLMQLQRTTSKHGHTGFEDLKNFIKDGSDFAKQIVEIIQVQNSASSTKTECRKFEKDKVYQMLLAK